MPITIAGSSTAPAPGRVVYRRTPTLVGAISGLSEMALGVGFFVTWVNPGLLGAGWVKFALELMMLEFVLIHSAPFLGMAAVAVEDRQKRRLAIGGLVLMYSTIVLGFCLSLDSWRPMITFWVVTAQRLAGHFIGPAQSDESKAWFMIDLALCVMLYLGFVMLTILVPIPDIAIRGTIRATLHVDGGGLWVDEPQRVVVLAGLYYFFRGWATAGAHPRKTEPVPKS